MSKLQDLTPVSILLWCFYFLCPLHNLREQPLLRCFYRVVPYFYTFREQWYTMLLKIKILEPNPLSLWPCPCCSLYPNLSLISVSWLKVMAKVNCWPNMAEAARIPLLQWTCFVVFVVDLSISLSNDAPLTLWSAEETVTR